MTLNDARNTKNENMKPLSNLLIKKPSPSAYIANVVIDATNYPNNTIAIKQCIVDSTWSNLTIESTPSGKASNFIMHDSIPMYMVLAVGKNTSGEGIQTLTPGDLITIRENKVYEESKEYDSTNYIFKHDDNTEFITHSYARIHPRQVGEVLQSYTSRRTGKQLNPGGNIVNTKEHLKYARPDVQTSSKLNLP